MASRSADDHRVQDITGDPDALARAAAIVDQHSLERVREKVRAVVEIEQALRLAVAERNQALRNAATANPDCRAAALAREVGLTPSSCQRRYAEPMRFGLARRSRQS